MYWTLCACAFFEIGYGAVFTLQSMHCTHRECVVLGCRDQGSSCCALFYLISCALSYQWEGTHSNCSYLVVNNLMKLHTQFFLSKSVAQLTHIIWSALNWGLYASEFWGPYLRSRYTTHDFSPNRSLRACSRSHGTSRSRACSLLLGYRSYSIKGKLILPASFTSNYGITCIQTIISDAGLKRNAKMYDMSCDSTSIENTFCNKKE